MKAQQHYDWRFFSRVALKTGLLFLLCNLLFAITWPLETVGHLSLYNVVYPGRERLPYGENTAVAYNLSLFNVPAMLASHTLSQPKQSHEARVVLLGDSNTWGWFLENEDTLAGQMNALAPQDKHGRDIITYSLGYPIMSLTKDLMFMEEALAHNPDLIIWLVTLESFPRDKQLFAPVVQNNPHRIRSLITQYNLDLDPQDERFVEPQGWERSLIGQRRNLADLARLQQYGISWAATGIDQFIPAEIPQRQNDFEADESWQDFAAPATLTTDDLAFDVLEAGVTMASEAGVPVLIINEPMFVADGVNSSLRYNSFYPRWAYDQYRGLLADTAVARNWLYRDWWQIVPPEEFTDTPVHLTPAGSALVAEQLVNEVQAWFDNTAVDG
jgi:hypothetical protein